MSANPCREIRHGFVSLLLVLTCWVNGTQFNCVRRARLNGKVCHTSTLKRKDFPYVLSKNKLISHRCKQKKMNPLLKTALLRFIAFSLLTSLSAWLFVFVEYTGKNEVHEKYQSLRSLYESMAWKYNMSINEFNNFSNAVYEAMSVPAPVWTYHNAMDFVLQAVTTIGEIRSY